MSIPVPAPPVIPEFPTLADKSAGQWNAKAIHWANALPTAGAALQALAVNTYANAQAAEAAQAQAEAQAGAAAGWAAAAASSASAASAVALGAAHFAGEWAGLSGPLARPACVRHAGIFWLLLADLPDVRAAEPGTPAGSAWASLTGDGMPSQTMSASATAVPGVTYLCPDASYLLTWPASLVKGQRLGFVNVSASVAQIDCAGWKVRGQAVDGARITFEPRQGYVFVFEDEKVGVY